MLDISEIVKVAGFCIKNKCGDTASAIMINPTQAPDYRKHCKNAPGLCLNNFNDRTANKTCREFYAGFSTVPKEEFCPFGIKIKYDCIAVESKKICLYTQAEYNFDAVQKASIQLLPRQAKKDVKKAISHPPAIDKRIAEDNHDHYLKVLKTLLDGRISLSMRGLTHVLFTPLQGAMADLDNVLGETDKADSLQRLAKNLTAINDIVQQIRTLTSNETQVASNMLRHVTVHRIVETITEQLKSETDDKNIIISQGFNPIATVKAIPNQLNIVLNNLIQNAVKYSFNGFKDNPLEVRIEYARENKFLKITISNEGCCITEDEITDSKLFGLSYRGKYSKDRNREGTGTGLYIAKQIIEAHKGKIEVSSRAIGTSSSPETQRYLNQFSIYWPIHQ